jgi:tRNA threonylcarbamoyladenosine biosynthesis protein TsaB
MLLAIDTCGATGSIALGRWNDDQAVSVIAEATLANKTYAAEFVPKLKELLAEHGRSLAEIAAIVVVHGPGSFTGVRIGVSSAKGLAEALAIPIVAVSRLAVLAHKAGSDTAAIDAGRGQFYFGAQPQELLLTPDESRLVSVGTLAVCEETAARSFPEAIFIDPPSAADALMYAVPRLLAKDFDDAAVIDGNYVRRSDAELFARPATQAAPVGNTQA